MARAMRTRTRRSLRSTAMRAPASKVMPVMRPGSSRAPLGAARGKDRVGPASLFVADRAASLLERSGKHFFPAGSIEEGDVDGVVDESGYGARLPACDQGSNIGSLRRNGHCTAPW